jgi:hypothetical protein
MGSRRLGGSGAAGNPPRSLLLRAATGVATIRVPPPHLHLKTPKPLSLSSSSLPTPCDPPPRHTSKLLLVLSPRLPPVPPQAESNQTLFLAFRQPAPVSLAPCANFTQATAGACAAVANDTIDGDVTPYIIAVVTAICPPPVVTTAMVGGEEEQVATPAPCFACSIAGLVAGACLPGRYRISYRVTGSGGRTTTVATLDVLVERVGEGRGVKGSNFRVG